MKILKRFVKSGKNIEVLDWKLPVWVTEEEIEDRFDNNYYSPAYIEAEEKVKSLRIKKLESLMASIQSGINPSKGGDIPVLEGRNLLPNCIIPNIEKYVKLSEKKKEKLLKENDILIIKDGSPGTVSIVLKPSLEFFDGLVTVGEHIYIIRLKEDHANLAPIHYRIS